MATSTVKCYGAWHLTAYDMDIPQEGETAYFNVRMVDSYGLEATSPERPYWGQSYWHFGVTLQVKHNGEAIAIKEKKEDSGTTTALYWNVTQETGTRLSFCIPFSEDSSLVGEDLVVELTSTSPAFYNVIQCYGWNTTLQEGKATFKITSNRANNAVTYGQSITFTIQAIDDDGNPITNYSTSGLNVNVSGGTFSSTLGGPNMTHVDTPSWSSGATNVTGYVTGGGANIRFVDENNTRRYGSVYAIVYATSCVYRNHTDYTPAFGFGSYCKGESCIGSVGGYWRRYWSYGNCCPNVYCPRVWYAAIEDLGESFCVASLSIGGVASINGVPQNNCAAYIDRGDLERITLELSQTSSVSQGGNQAGKGDIRGISFGIAGADVVGNDSTACQPVNGDNWEGIINRASWIANVNLGGSRSQTLNLGQFRKSKWSYRPSSYGVPTGQTYVYVAYAAYLCVKSYGLSQSPSPDLQPANTYVGASGTPLGGTEQRGGCCQRYVHHYDYHYDNEGNLISKTPVYSTRHWCCQGGGRASYCSYSGYPYGDQPRGLQKIGNFTWGKGTSPPTTTITVYIR